MNETSSWSFLWKGDRAGECFLSALHAGGMTIGSEEGTITRVRRLLSLVAAFTDSAADRVRRAGGRYNLYTIPDAYDDVLS